MAKAEPKSEREKKRQTFWDKLDRFLIIGGPIDVDEDAENDEDEFRLKPGSTIK